jgi:hypothetical protein
VLYTHLLTHWFSKYSKNQFFGIWLWFSKIWKRQRTTSSLLVPSWDPPVLHIGECSSHAFPNSPILVLVEIQFHWVHCNKRTGTSLFVSMCINITWIPPFLTWIEVIALFTIKWRNHFCPNLKTSNNFGFTCYNSSTYAHQCWSLIYSKKKCSSKFTCIHEKYSMRKWKKYLKLHNNWSIDHWTIMIMSLIQIYTNLIEKHILMLQGYIQYK